VNICPNLVEIRSATSEIKCQKMKKKKEKTTAVKHKPFVITMPCGLNSTQGALHAVLSTTE